MLEGAGLLTHRKEGRVRHCRLVAEPMREAASWIERYREFWEVRFDALAEVLLRQEGMTSDDGVQANRWGWDGGLEKLEAFLAQARAGER